MDTDRQTEAYGVTDPYSDAPITCVTLCGLAECHTLTHKLGFPMPWTSSGGGWAR